MESLIKDLLKQNFKDSNTKSTHAITPNTISISYPFVVSKDALKVYCHYLELFVKEGAVRAAHQAQLENSKTVEFEHLEQVFVQLLLDF